MANRPNCQDPETRGIQSQTLVREDNLMERVACIGECMLELSGADTSRMQLSYGGDTLNTATYLARLGVAVDYVTALGDDPYSDWMVEQWRGEGIGTDLVVRAAGRLPGIHAIRTDTKGERQFYYWRDQAPARDLFAFPESEAIADRLIEYEWIYLTGVTLSLYDDARREKLFELLDRARMKGTRVAFDSNYRPRGWPGPEKARTVFEEILKRTDLAAPTLDDDRQVFGDPDQTACADRLLDSGVDEVVVKLDAEGCLVATQDMRELIPTAPVSQPFDTTGAGDALNAGYLAGRMGGMEAPEAARHAHRLAGAVIMHPGAIMPRSAMPEHAT